jgi:ferredoxin-NADP reductase
MSSKRDDQSRIYESNFIDEPFFAVVFFLRERVAIIRWPILYDIGDIKFAASKQGGGLCDSEAISVFARDSNERIIYLCGPPPMMKFVKKELKKLGIKKSQIISEEFSF